MELRQRWCSPKPPLLVHSLGDFRCRHVKTNFALFPRLASPPRYARPCGDGGLTADCGLLPGRFGPKSGNPQGHMLHRTYSETAQHIRPAPKACAAAGSNAHCCAWPKGGSRRPARDFGARQRQGSAGRRIPLGVELIRLGDAHYSALFALAGHVRTASPDLIFCPGNHYSAVAAMTRLRLGRASPPIVAKVSNALVRPEQGRIAAWTYRRWLRLHPRFLDHVVAMTPAMAAEAIAEMRMSADRVSVIANPPATSRPDAAPVRLPRRALHRRRRPARTPEALGPPDRRAS